MTEEVLATLRVGRIQADADDAEPSARSSDLERLDERSPDPCGDGADHRQRSAVLRAQVGHQQEELIPTLAGNQVGLPRHGEQPLRDAAQEFVAGPNGPTNRSRAWKSSRSM